MTSQVKERWSAWSSRQLEDTDLSRELEEIKEDEAAISDRFYKELEFGTGGLRGVIGAGTNRMNIYTVAKASQGYADYLNQGKRPASVAVAYDSRIKSELFARTAAEVFAANGLHVYIYKELMPTPSLSFAVRYLNCAGGIVVTASHNPAKYNGYKVYGSDGCQITSKAAKDILNCIDQVDTFEGVRKLSFEEAMKAGRISYIEDEVITAYINAVSAESLCGDQLKKDVSIVYTPLNGTGRYCVTRALEENGFHNVKVVAEQQWPDGNFPTCPYPNPEVREALELAVDYAKRTDSDLVLATDPDCDRVGIAVRNSQGEYTLLSGNEVGVLLLDYVCSCRKALGCMPEKPVAVKTIVTMDMAKQVAADHHVELREVLTGFKYIGEQIGLLEAEGEEKRYIFGFEESYGYLSGSYVRDKDGVDASLLICEMFAFYKAQGRTLLEVLEGLYDRYGYCLTTLRSYAFEGEAGFARMQAIMEGLRTRCPESFAGKKVLSVSDYEKSITENEDGSQEEIHLPKSNVLKFRLEGNSSLVVRPSGTEPKLKIYFSVSSSSRPEAKALEEQIAGEIEQRLNCYE